MPSRQPQPEDGYLLFNVGVRGTSVPAHRGESAGRTPCVVMAARTGAGEALLLRLTGRAPDMA